MWQVSFNGATHCGAGCAPGDFIGDWLAFATGFVLLGSELGGKYVAAFAFAYLFGIVFQYFSVAPMREPGLRDGVVAAVKIDTLSLLAYEVGMFAWMGLRSWLYPDLQPTSRSDWLMMQVAMVLGFATTYPVNWWLISQGVKKKDVATLACRMMPPLPLTRNTFAARLVTGLEGVGCVIIRV